MEIPIASNQYTLPPSSNSDLDVEFVSIKQFVQFKNINTEYVQGEPLKCTYILANYRSQPGDRIAIYRVGWSSIKQYVAFEWVPVDDHSENFVIFNKHSLPKNTSDMYQFCYVSCHHETHGVSPPFQFVESKLKLSLETLKLSMYDSAYGNSAVEKELTELKSENQIFRHRMRALTNMMISMQSLMEGQQTEIDNLRSKLDDVASRRIKCSCDSVHAKDEKNFDVDLEELEPLPPFPL